MATHVSIDVDPNVLAQVCRDLDLDPPPQVIVSYAGDGRFKRVKKLGGYEIMEHRGRFNPDGEVVRVVNTHATIRTAPLPVATRQVTFTLLHELRHAWQRRHWDEATQEAAKMGPYEARMEEIDANEFAEKNLAKYPGLVRLVRQSTSTRRRLP